MPMVLLYSRGSGSHRLKLKFALSGSESIPGVKWLSLELEIKPVVTPI